MGTFGHPAPQRPPDPECGCTGGGSGQVPGSDEGCALAMPGWVLCSDPDAECPGKCGGHNREATEGPYSGERRAEVGPDPGS